MCETDCNNLIDLSLDEEISCRDTQDKTEYETQPSKAITEEPSILSSPTYCKRVSLDDNPFDSVQKLVNRQDDPFEIVEKEIRLKAQQALNQRIEVKEGNLLSLSDDNLLDVISTPICTIAGEGLEKAKTKELDLESPPVMMNLKLPPGSESDSNPSSSAETTGSAKLKTAMEYRKRLLKLSISNAAFSSPVTRKNSLEIEDALDTPVTAMLTRAAEFGEHLLSTESPLKLVDDEITGEEPSTAESDKIFEADLEMLKIPILNNIPSAAVESLNTNTNENTSVFSPSKKQSLETNFSNLDTIKAKLKAKREKVNHNHHQEVDSLINSLKTLITSGDMIDENKKQHASSLLESLSLALKPSNSEEKLKLPQEPQVVKRQGTFNLELDESEQIQLETHHLEPDMPACMISSTATFDGDSAEDKQHLNLPEIVSLSPPDMPHENEDCDHNSNENSQNQIQSDVSDILEQLGKLLINNNSGENGQNSQNPTFIVVMNTNPIVQNNNTLQTPVDCMEYTINDGSPDLTKVNPMPRRRAQSLSLHDKVKIVQIPIQLPTSRSNKKRHSIQLDDSPPVSTTPVIVDKESSDFKTPSRMTRRNSFSSGTPYTSHVGLRRTGFRSDAKNSVTQLRKTQILDTHQEGHVEQTVVMPIPMPSNKMPTFKPDLKKKTKNTESIIKFSGPLKATIPVKNVVPMLKTSPPTPDTGKNFSSLHNTSLQSQLGKTNRVPTTPLPEKEEIRIGYPNACSTPAAFSSPLKRVEVPVNKPRYSYMSATPNSKTALNSYASTNLKRRSITELKAKSPLKSRASSVGLAATSTSSRSSTGSLRLSTSAGGRVSKTPVKVTASNTASVRAPGHLASRFSVSGSGISARNKENKKP